MKIRHIMTVAAAAVFITTGAQAKTDSTEVRQKFSFPLKIESKKKLKEDKARLLGEIDSLKAELERYRIEDSLSREIINLYEAEEEARDTVTRYGEYTAEVSDSLLDIWYTHKKVAEFEYDILDVDSIRFESNVPDSVYVDRIKAMNSFITLPYNDIVKRNIILYSEKMPERMAHMLGLCEYYMPIFQETFNRYDMPEELKAMAIIESAMNPLAVSRVGAKGMWQFMYQTAKSYGLNINSFVDERLDPVKSADAAARYLMDAYEIFGDWNLAIASYNCGAGNVKKAIRRSGGSRAFWDIWPYLPRETRGYVPAFVGALYTMTYYKEHGIRPEAVQMPVHVDTFKINKMLHLKQINEVIGVPLDELKNLNPQYKHEIIPGNSKEYILRLPYSYSNAFIEHEDSIYRHKADKYFNPVTLKSIQEGGDGEQITYRVKSGDYLGKIASRYGTTVAKIKKWNNLKSNDIRVGQRLIIYRGGNAPATSSSSSSSTKTQSTSTTTTKSSTTSSTTTKAPEAKPVDPNAPYTEYVVKNGESLYLIAKKFPGVSAQNIMDFNGIGSNIKPGMKIKIPKL